MEEHPGIQKWHGNVFRLSDPANYMARISDRKSTTIMSWVGIAPMNGIVARLSHIYTSFISYFLVVYIVEDSRGRTVRLKFVIGYLFLFLT